MEFKRKNKNLLCYYIWMCIWLAGDIGSWFFIEIFMYFWNGKMKTILLISGVASKIYFLLERIFENHCKIVEEINDFINKKWFLSCLCWNLLYGRWEGWIFIKINIEYMWRLAQLKLVDQLWINLLWSNA